MNLDRFRNSLIQNDYNDIFSNVLLLLTLWRPQGIEIIGPLKSKFKDDANAMIAISQYETQFNDLQKMTGTYSHLAYNTKNTLYETITTSFSAGIF